MRLGFIFLYVALAVGARVALSANASSKGACFHTNIATEREDCFRPLLELYYGKEFSRTCTDFAKLLAEGECRGCPWRRGQQQWLPAERSCSISKVAKSYPNERSVRVQQLLPAAVAAFVLSLFVGLPLRVKDRVLARRYLFGKRVPEALAMLLQWAVYTAGNLLMLPAETFASVCETPAAGYAQYFARVLVGTTFRALSLWQCAFMNTARRGSTESFLSALQPGRRFRARDAARILLAALAALLSGVYLFAIFSGRMREFKCSNLCRLGARVTWFGLCQYLRVVLEIVAVTTFAFGRRTNRALGVTRYVVLVLALGGSFALSIPNVKIGLWEHTVDMLIPGIQDRFVSNWLEAISHISILCVMAFSALI